MEFHKRNEAEKGWKTALYRTEPETIVWRKFAMARQDGPRRAVVETPAMKAGKKFESAILQMLRRGNELQAGARRRLPTHYLRQVPAPRGVPRRLEPTCKFRSMQRTSSGKTRSGATLDQFPEYKAAPGSNDGTGQSAMFAGFFIYSMEYDEDMAQKILDASENFGPYVENDKMPEADGRRGHGIHQEFARDAAINRKKSLKGLQKANSRKGAEPRNLKTARVMGARPRSRACVPGKTTRTA